MASKAEKHSFISATNSLGVRISESLVKSLKSVNKTVTES
jgi:hypothetical protein